MLQHALLAFLVAFVGAAVVANPILSSLIALKSRQTIHAHVPQHQQKQGTPTMGGLIILFGLSASVLLITGNWKVVVWMLGFALIGFGDDYIVPRLMTGKRGLGWKQKFAAEIVLSVLAAPVFGMEFNLVNVGVTAFLVLFYSNAYNFADGLDALAGSLGIVLCAGFMMLFAMGGDKSLMALLAALMGGFIPFLFLNAPPARVFMGDVGALPIGAIFGAVASRLVLANWQTGALPVFILSFMMVAELVPVPMQVGYYKLTKKRLFPMTPIHHSFEKIGWPETRVVWTFFLAQVTLAAFSLAVAIFLKISAHSAAMLER
jgi:phospho-N-acetylmuramoyl-pentapeptide-transferase